MMRFASVVDGTQKGPSTGMGHCNRHVSMPAEGGIVAKDGDALIFSLGNACKTSPLAREVQR
jgi:hypothetical protein